MTPYESLREAAETFRIAADCPTHWTWKLPDGRTIPDGRGFADIMADWLTSEAKRYQDLGGAPSTGSALHVALAVAQKVTEVTEDPAVDPPAVVTPKTIIAYTVGSSWYCPSCVPHLDGDYFIPVPEGNTLPCYDYWCDRCLTTIARATDQEA